MSISARIGAMTCTCCGEQESTSGCVQGLRCHCYSEPECELCTKCPDHHHRNCTPELREKAEQINVQAMLDIAKLRDEYKINIFQHGQSSEEGLRTIRRPHRL